MRLHYLVKLVARVLSPYSTNSHFLWQKVTFHNSLNVKMFTNTHRRCWFADVILFIVTDCSNFYTKCVITLHNGCMWLKESKTLKTVTANVISSQTIKRQSHNAQLQQQCFARSHSSCSNCPPSAAAHARSRFRHSFTAPSIMRWSRRSHSSTMRWRSSSTFAIFPLL